MIKQAEIKEVLVIDNNNGLLSFILIFLQYNFEVNFYE